MNKLSHYYYITPEEYSIANQNGISATLLEIRVRTLAWDKEKAIHTPPHEKKSLKDWVQVAEENGICYSTLRYRANRLGWDLERAATQPIQDRAAQALKACEKSRKYPKEYIELAVKNGIAIRTFYGRLKAGWDLETAAVRPAMSHREIGLMTKEKTRPKFYFKGGKIRCSPLQAGI